MPFVARKGVTKDATAKLDAKSLRIESNTGFKIIEQQGLKIQN